MPYQWSEPTNGTSQRLELWPYQSLPPKGLAAFVLATFGMIITPLFGLLGTTLLWALLPFLLISVGAIWFALNKSRKDRNLFETLTVTPELTSLQRINPKTQDQHWQCNTYWVQVKQYTSSGPVPAYITLTGNGREVEIGAFLSQEEREQLFSELTEAFATSRLET